MTVTRASWPKSDSPKGALGTARAGGGGDWTVTVPVGPRGVPKPKDSPKNSSRSLRTRRYRCLVWPCPA